jgi:hypothetical protein
MTGAQAPANWNVVMDLLLDLRNVIWVLPMPTQPINANSLARPPNVVMDLLIPLRNVIMLPPDPLLLHAETTANSHTVVMLSSTPFMVRIVMLDFQETMISQAPDVQPDAHKTHVDTPLQLEVISTEPWLAQDVSMPMLVQPPAHHAVDLFNGWLLNQFRRFLNSKLINSNTSGVAQSEEVKRETANSLILILRECATVFLKLEASSLLLVILAWPFPESLLFKPLLIFSPEILLEPLFFNKPL